jgi:hypothetical protein
MQPSLDAGRLVFVDETWASTNMARGMGRGRRGERVAAAVPHGDWKTSTFVVGLRTDGIVAPVVLDGALYGAASTPHAAGEGSKGVRLYDWARIALPWTVDAGFERWLLIRRSRRAPDARAYSLVFAPAGSGLAELAGAAGLRRTATLISAAA